MVFGAILAGGSGSRMGNFDTPKQFLPLGDKPILVHTAEKFVIHPEIDVVLVLCPKPWVSQTRDMLQKSLGDCKKIVVLAGGATRNETLEQALLYIETQYPQEKDAIIVTHDAVRPFLTHRILSENIEKARDYGATDTVVPATDTIVVSEDGRMIRTIPERSMMYQGQTPQSFQAAKLRRVLNSLTQQERSRLTDACMIFSLKEEPVYLVQGEVFNIKITYPYDLEVANTLLIREQAADTNSK